MKVYTSYKKNYILNIKSMMWQITLNFSLLYFCYYFYGIISRIVPSLVLEFLIGTRFKKNVNYVPKLV